MSGQQGLSFQSGASFQNGDVPITLNGQDYTLRLTLGSLAEMATRLSALTPEDLARHIQTSTPQDIRVILSCLIVGPSSRVELETVTDADILTGLPSLCAVFETAFS